MGAFLGVVGLLAFFVGLVMLVMVWLRKKPKKRAVLVTVVGFALIMVGYAIDPTIDSDTNSATDKAKENVVPASSNKSETEKVDAQKIEAEKKKKEDEKKQKAAAEKKKKEEAKKAESEKKATYTKEDEINLAEGYEWVMNESEGIITNISPLNDDSYDVIYAYVVNEVKLLNDNEKQYFVDKFGSSIVGQTRVHIFGGDPSEIVHVYFKYEDGTALADPKMLDPGWKIKN